MDTSKQYIKMCDCPQIQEDSSWCMNPDSLVAQRHIIPELGVYIVTTIWRWETGGISTEDYHNRFIWLPRQDQLQEMVGEKFPFILNSFHDYAIHEACELPQYPTSMEQLWLAFVMKEKYNKTWDGEKWE